MFLRTEHLDQSLASEQVPGLGFEENTYRKPMVFWGSGVEHHGFPQVFTCTNSLVSASLILRPGQCGGVDLPLGRCMTSQKPAMRILEELPSIQSHFVDGLGLMDLHV